MSDIDELVEIYLGEGKKRKKSSNPRKTPINKLPEEERERIKAEKTETDKAALDAYAKKYGIKVSNRTPMIDYSGYSVHLTKKQKKKLGIGSIEDELEYWVKLSRTLMYHKKRLSVGSVSPTALRYNRKYQAARGGLSDVKSKIDRLKDKIKEK